MLRNDTKMSSSSRHQAIAGFSVEALESSRMVFNWGIAMSGGPVRHGMYALISSFGQV